MNKHQFHQQKTMSRDQDAPDKDTNMQIFDFITKFPPDLIDMILNSLDNKTLLEACSSNAKIFRSCLANKTLRERLKFYLRIRNTMSGKNNYNEAIHKKQAGPMRIRLTKHQHPIGFSNIDKFFSAGAAARFIEEHAKIRKIRGKSPCRMGSASTADSPGCPGRTKFGKGVCKFPQMCPGKSGVDILRGVIFS